MTILITESSDLREQDIREWISRKESVCPYAPGLARFVQLPEITSPSMQHVYYLAKELKAFYDAKENGKRVGRWMLMPAFEWTSHEQAHFEAEQVFWLLNAAYYYLKNDKDKVKSALNMDLPGYSRGYMGEILNPVIGKLPQQNAALVPVKSLFYSALSPLYKSKQFYRYSPHCIMPLVYAEEFHKLKTKHPKVTENVCFEIAKSGLYELFGDDLNLDLEAFRRELPLWGAIIDRVAEIFRASATGKCSHDEALKGCPASNLALFRLCKTNLVNQFYEKYADYLVVLNSLIDQTRADPRKIIAASFAGSGLYTIPDYQERIRI
jgi:hypothetical protein